MSNILDLINGGGQKGGSNSGGLLGGLGSLLGKK